MPTIKKEAPERYQNRSEEDKRRKMACERYQNFTEHFLLHMKMPTIKKKLLKDIKIFLKKTKGE